MDSSTRSLTIAGVSERDIDLLLLEEFIASPNFARWFVQQARVKNCEYSEVANARRSVAEAFGESDLEIELSNPSGGRWYLLIENKIGAAFQPRQAERYLERGGAYEKRGACEGFTTILVAPSEYLGEASSLRGFHAVLAYEDILSWFVKQESLGLRSKYKQALLQSAIEKAVHGYQLIEDAPVTNFWRSYWQLSLEVAPELEMAEPIGKPSRASFVYFRPGSLPQGVSIVHKLGHGFLDLQFDGMGESLSQMRTQSAHLLLPGMTIERAAKSAVIRQRVPTFDMARDFRSQEVEVRSCMERARELLRWYLGVTGGSEGASDRFSPR